MNSTTRGTLLRYDPEQELFEPVLGGESAFYAEPSPDGEWLAWVRYPEGTLWRARTDGSERLQLTRPPAVAHLPRWSADGTQLVFISQPDPRALTEIRVAAADGSASRLIARPEPGDGGYWDACWLPDDSIILSRMSQPGLLRYDPSARRLVPVPGAERLIWPKCARQGHVWANPGHLRRWGQTEWRELSARVGGFASWTRDGQALCGLRDWRIRCLDVNEGRTWDLADTSRLQLASWTGVPWMGLDAEDRPLVVASQGTASVHVIILDQP